MPEPLSFGFSGLHGLIRNGLGADCRTLEQKQEQEALLLAAFRCVGKKARLKMLRVAMKTVRGATNSYPAHLIL